MSFKAKTRNWAIPLWLDPWLVLTWILVLLILFRPVVHGSDPVGYYSWVRSVVIQGNLDVTDEFDHYGIPDARPQSATGHKANPWSVGPALLWLPFYLVAHALVGFAGVLGVGIVADGYAWPYPAACALASAVYALVGLILLESMLCKWMGKAAARLSVVTIWLASPLIFYMSANPLMSHACEFFAIVLFFWVWMRTEGGGEGRWFVLGLAGGLAVCVRFQQAPIFALAACYCLFQTFRDGARLWALFRSLLWLGAGGLLAFLPQLITWKVVFGSWYVGNPYAVSGETLDWMSPHFLDSLFSSTRGLFVWVPVAVPAAWGLFLWSRKEPRWTVIAVFHALAQVYIVGSWYGWTGAASFGPRLMTSVLPVLAFGFGAFLAREERPRQGSYLLCSLLVAWNLLLLARYGLQDIPRSGPISWEQLVVGQFRFLARLPESFPRLLEGLLRQLG